ncbi:hypothetical protein RFI_38834, partial [Reticulomyxa filosa]
KKLHKYNRYSQGVEEDSYAAICTLVGALEENTCCFEYRTKDQSYEQSENIAENMFAQICKKSEVASIFDGIALEESFRNLTLPATSSKLMITVYVFKDVDDAYSPVMVEVLASSKICVLKHRLKEILKNTEEDNLCLGYVNVSNKLSELVTVVDDQEDVSSFIFKKRGFFYANQVVDIQECSNYLEEEKTDQFVIFPVLQCIAKRQYYRINFCKVPKKSQYKSMEIVNNFKTLFQGDEYINVAGDWLIDFDKPLSLTIVFYQHQFQQVDNIFFSKFLIFVMVYKLLKNKSSLTVSDFVSLCCLHICNCISRLCDWISRLCSKISHSCNWIPHFCSKIWYICSETRRNAADTDESKLMEDQSHNNRVEVQEPITCEVEYSKFNGHHSRILNETFQ